MLRNTGYRRVMPPVSVGPAPFLKWAGGKRQLLPRILAYVPPQVDTYYEPFLGGGAVFFAMARAGRFRRAVVGDANEELVSCYRTIQDDVEKTAQPCSGATISDLVGSLSQAACELPANAPPAAQPVPKGALEVTVTPESTKIAPGATAKVSVVFKNIGEIGGNVLSVAPTSAN